MTAPYAPVDFVVATLRRYVSEGDVLVDVGCGPAIYRDATEGRYLGVDREPRPYGDGGGRVDVVASADDLPLEDGSADVLFTLSAFYAFDDHAAALRQFRRVLRPGGRVILFDYNRRAQRRLEVSEHAPRPKWTASRLRRTVRGAGFESVEILLPRVDQPRGIKRTLLLAREELRGQWAIVTGIRP